MFLKTWLKVAGSFCSWLAETPLGNSTGPEAPDSAASDVGSETSTMPSFVYHVPIEEDAGLKLMFVLLLAPALPLLPSAHRDDPQWHYC